MSRPDTLSILLTGSFVPLAVKAVDYLLIGGWTPAAVLTVFATIVCLARRRSAVAYRCAVRLWAMALVCWALARTFVLVAYFAAPLDEAHLLAQFTPWYVIVTVAHLVLGIFLFRRAGSLPPPKTGLRNPPAAGEDRVHPAGRPGA